MRDTLHEPLWLSRIPRLARRCLLVSALLAVVLRPNGEARGDNPPAFSEYQVKAAFIFNFPRYTEWPANAFAATNSPIVVAVVGQPPLAVELRKATRRRAIDGRSIVVKDFEPGEDPGGCHVLFISAAEQQRSSDLLDRYKEKGVLTVGETDDFLERGGIINLPRRQERIVMEVNLTAAGHAGIKISSKLLGVATVVKGRQR
jgi:hypothetical protein